MRRKYGFPKLEAMNLYAAPITGNGNCLFNALSDQLHGDQSLHVEFRAATMKYMRANATHFKSFVVVHPGGGTRRSERITKRKNPGALSKSSQSKEPTTEEVEAAFQQHLKAMEQGGAYGDNMEIIAFANSYAVNVCIYSEEMSNFLYVKCDDDSGKVARTAYIVHHAWEHYSSIRNASGPHTGPPNVVFVHPSPETEATLKDELAKHSYVKTWMIDEIQEVLPYTATREAISEALETYKGNMTRAVSCLMPASSQSSSRSSSIERELESDEEIDLKPNKKADRRPSRPQPLRFSRPNRNFTADAEASNSASPDPSQLSAALSKLTGNDAVDQDETEEEDWHNESPYKDSGTTSVSTSTSESSAASKGGAGPIVRIRLSQPRKPVEKPYSKSDESNERSHAGEYDADGEKSRSSRVIAKPRRRLICGAERDRLNAERIRKATRRTSLSPTSANSKKSGHSPPVIDVGIKILSI